MFRITDNVITPKRALFEDALKRLPQAHHTAQGDAAEHLHRHVSEAVEANGHDPDAVGIGWRDDGTAYVGINHSDAGDRLFDDEFGTEDVGPHSTIRSTVARKQHESDQVYQDSLRRELGI